MATVATSTVTSSTRGSIRGGGFGLADRTGIPHLTITRTLSIFPKNTQTGPPICVETTGSWSGTGGVLLGYKGTFLFTDDETLVLR